MPENQQNASTARITRVSTAINNGKTSCRGIGACNWRKPHAEHRRGTVMDVRANGQQGSLSPIDFLEFQDLVTFNGGTFLHEGEGTQNEHYHVRFLGRAQ